MERIESAVASGDGVALAQLIGPLHHDDEIDLHSHKATKAKILLKCVQNSRCNAERQASSAILRVAKHFATNAMNELKTQ